jgi:hypothetical protein
VALAFVPVRREIDGKSFGAQTARDEFRQFAIIFDDEYSHGDYLIPVFQSVRIRVPLDLH